MNTDEPSNLQESDILRMGPQKAWPTMYDLPSESPDDASPDQFHVLQEDLLGETLHLETVPEGQVFHARNMNLYYDLDTPTWSIRPDWFAVVGVPRFYGGSELRLSYVVWDEQVIPSIVVELISPGTLMADLGEVRKEQNGTPTKWHVYEKILKVPNYVVFNRFWEQLNVFRLVDGSYQEQSLEDERFWFDDLKLGLGLLECEYEHCTRLWLRWYDANGNWLLTDLEKIRNYRLNRVPNDDVQKQRRSLDNIAEERSPAEKGFQQRKAAKHIAELERSQRQKAESKAQSEAERAEQERSRADRLAEKLRELGIDPDEV